MGKWYIPAQTKELSDWVPAAIAKATGAGAVQRTEPAREKQTINGVDILPLTDNGSGAGPYQTATRSITYDGSTATAEYVLSSIPLAERKAAMIATLKQTFAAKRDTGTTVNFGAGDVAIKTDPQARSDVVSLYDDLVQREADGEVDPTQTFATAEYVVVQDCTIAMAKSLRDAVAAHWRGVWERDAELGASINAAANGAALDLIDIEAGSIDGSGSWFS